MAKLRIPLSLILALLLSLTGDPGARVSAADGSCTVLEGGSPESGLTGDGALPEVIAPVATIDKGGRSVSAVLSASVEEIRWSLSTISPRSAPAAPIAASTPLYLRHCAVLC